MGVCLYGGDQGVSDCAFVPRAASIIWLRSGALQVSPNLKVSGKSDGHSFLEDLRHSLVVWLQMPEPGGHVSHGFRKEVCKHKLSLG